MQFSHHLLFFADVALDDISMLISDLFSEIVSMLMLYFKIACADIFKTAISHKRSSIVALFVHSRTLSKHHDTFVKAKTLQPKTEFILHL